MRLLKIALGIIFLIEIVLPFTVFFPGPWSAFGAAPIAFYPRTGPGSSWRQVAKFGGPCKCASNQKAGRPAAS